MYIHYIFRGYEFLLVFAFAHFVVIRIIQKWAAETDEEHLATSENAVYSTQSPLLSINQTVVDIYSGRAIRK